MLSAADVVVRMGCGAQCPVLPGRRYEDWPINDPVNARPQAVHASRDDLNRRVLTLLASLLAALTPTPLPTPS